MLPARKRARDSADTVARACGVVVRVGSRTDSPIVPYGLGLLVELESYVHAGLTPFQALQTATVNAANALGLGDQLGTIEPGKTADLAFVGRSLGLYNVYVGGRLAGDRLVDLYRADVAQAVERLAVQLVGEELAFRFEHPHGIAQCALGNENLALRIRSESSAGVRIPVDD